MLGFTLRPHFETLRCQLVRRLDAVVDQTIIKKLMYYPKNLPMGLEKTMTHVKIVDFFLKFLT
jgi:hypothetical protein